MLQRYDFCRYRENLKVLFFVNFSKKYINKTSYSTFRTILRVDYLCSPEEIVYLQKKGDLPPTRPTVKQGTALPSFRDRETFSLSSAPSFSF